MKVHRFFIADEIAGDTYLIQDESLLHQITRVLRLRKGDRIILCGENATDYVSDITSLDKRHIEVRILKTEPVWVPSASVTLYCAQIRKELFELVVQKATELGISKIVPLTTERTERGVISNTRAHKIMQEASELCGRGDIPELGEAVSLGEVISGHTTAINLIMFDADGAPVPAHISAERAIGILIGPEGGWTPAEKRLLQEHNCSIYSLGPTTLRAETAAIVATSAVLRAIA